MQLLVTSAQMQQLDGSAIKKYSIPGIVLMENAGRCFVDTLEKHFDSVRDKRVLVVCGKGNNGGDGFVIARHLSNRGADVHVILLAKKKDVKRDAKTNLDILLKMVVSNQSSIRFDEFRSKKKFERLPKADFIVDAIFGTGFSGEVRGLEKDSIEWINNQQTFVASVDIPSGVDSTSGVVVNIAVRANLTITMGLAKIGHYVGGGRDHSGEVKIAEISIPQFLFQEPKTPTFRVEMSDVREALPRRSRSAHKYSVGKVLVIAGSRNLAGAPMMAALSAMRAGAGAVVLAVPKSIHAALVRKVTEVMVTPLDETEDGTISLKAIDKIKEKLVWADVVALGPGLSQNVETRQLVHKLVKEIAKPLVLDADGLGMIAYDPAILKKRTYETIITPHVGELRLLTKLDGEFIEANRVEVARTQSKNLNSILVLKGSPTVTGTGDGKSFLNSTGNPGMATAGSGDVLTGIVSSLLAQGMTAVAAAYCAVFVHGLAGDIAASKFGERSLMALDILDCIPEALRRIEQRA